MCWWNMTQLKYLGNSPKYTIIIGRYFYDLITYFQFPPYLKVHIICFLILPILLWYNMKIKYYSFFSKMGRTQKRQDINDMFYVMMFNLEFTPEKSRLPTVNWFLFDRHNYHPDFASQLFFQRMRDFRLFFANIFIVLYLLRFVRFDDYNRPLLYRRSPLIICGMSIEKNLLLSLYFFLCFSFLHNTLKM